MRDIHELEEKIGYAFKDIGLLETAMTHSSYVNEHKMDKLKCNERLEFLGDAVLGFVTAEFLYKQKPPLAEGQMTRLRAGLVCEKTLVTAAKTLDLGAYMRVGRGEESSGARERPSLLADAMEATFAAVFLDGGRAKAAKLINRLILSQADESARRSVDYKTALQELVQRTPGVEIAYSVVKEQGPDHMKEFTVEVAIGGVPRGRGEGASKKSAEQDAARAALEVLDKKQSS